MSRIYCIALNTFRESIRSKILYSLLCFAVLLVLISAFFGSVTIGDQVKVIKDFGLFAISLFSVLYAVTSGSALLFKELNRKTVYNILSKPVSRWEFLCGKYFGMLTTVGVMLFLMGLGFSLFVYFFEWEFSLALPVAYFHIFLELIIVCAGAIFFSSVVVTPILIGIFTFGFFLAGRSVSLLLYFIDEGAVSGFGARVLEALYWVLPHLEMINIVDKAVYTLPHSFGESAWIALYALSYAAMLLLLAHIVFQRREFN